MDSKFTAISSIVIIALGLLITSSLSQNLSSQQALTRSSEAQVSCELDDKRTRYINTGGRTCRVAIGVCLIGGRSKPVRSQEYCENTIDESKAKALEDIQNQCAGFCEKQEDPSDPDEPTATPTQAHSVNPGDPRSCAPEGDHWGRKCGEEGFTCCEGLTCSNTETGAKCDPKPEPGACESETYKIFAGRQCKPAGDVECCNGATCKDSENGAYCVPAPTATPTPTEIPLNGCYHQLCDENADCGDGESCHVIGLADQPKDMKTYCNRNPQNCRCVVNTECTQEPGGYDPNDFNKEACWCSDLNECPKEGDPVIFCLSDRFCQTKVNKYFKCINSVCQSPYCPKDTVVEIQIQEFKNRIDGNPSLKSSLREGERINLDSFLNDSQEVEEERRGFFGIFGF